MGNKLRVEVNGCDNCMFIRDVDSYCELKLYLTNFKDKKKCSVNRVETESSYEYKTPKWCPLKKNGGIKVKFK